MTSKIYIKPYSTPFNWDNCYEIPFEDYTNTETDFRNHTAKIVTDWNYDLANYSYAVKIVSDDHETFSGLLLKKHKAPMNMLEYDCQDWNRLYMSKPTMDVKASNYKIIKMLLNYCGSSSWVWKGLLSKNKYEQKKYGSTFSFNPMKNKNNISVKDKTVKELIQQIIYSTGAYIDIHYNTVGVMQFTPYHVDSWLKPVADFHYTEVIDYDWNFNTTDIITAVADGQKIWKFKDLFGGNGLSNMIYEQISLNDNVSSSNNTTTSSNKGNNKTSNTNSKTDNPYKTKKKEVWVNMDNCWGGSADYKYINTFCKELRKLGWKVHNLGPGSTIHTNYSLASKCRNGVWLTLDNGVDCEVLRHFGHDNWFKGQLVRHGSRAVIGFINNAGDIRKGGRYYKYLGMAHDGTGKGHPGLKYPAAYCADCGLPFFYSRGNNPKKAAALFNSGGESKIALNKNYNKKLKGYYANWNWGNKY